MLNLPPLNSLKSFESAARTGSYVAAAAELNVSPAAVSQQVRNLERFFRRKLFTLGDDVGFVPGHGETSTMGRERIHNPFVGEEAMIQWRAKFGGQHDPAVEWES